MSPRRAHTGRIGLTFVRRVSVDLSGKHQYGSPLSEVIMAKGTTCAACGAQTWHADKKGGRVCSSCGARGWLGGEKPSGGGGRGLDCQVCEAGTLMQVDEGTPMLRFCTNCGAVVLYKT